MDEELILSALRTLSQEELDAVLDYIDQIRGSPDPEVSPSGLQPRLKWQ